MSLCYTVCVGAFSANRCHTSQNSPAPAVLSGLLCGMLTAASLKDALWLHVHCSCKYTAIYVHIYLLIYLHLTSRDQLQTLYTYIHIC